MKIFLNNKIEEKIKSAHFNGKKKRFGVLGLHEGRTMIIGLDRTAMCEAVAGCDIDARKLEEIKAERPQLYYTTKYEHMLEQEDIDVIAIYTPDQFHGEHIVKAFEAGKDVICTKPLINSLKDAKQILSTGRRTGRNLLVGQSTRFFEPFRRQRLAYENGYLGELELIDAHYMHRMDWFYEKSPWAVTETDWIFLGLSHPIDLIRWYLGPIEEVQAYGYTSALGKKYGLKGFDIYTINLRGINGRIARALGHYGLKEMFSVRNCIELFLYGTNNTSMAQYHDMKYQYTADDGTEVCEDPLYELRHYHFNSEIHGMHYGEFANYADYFAEALINKSNFSPGIEEGVETFCIMEAIRRSARTNKPVSVLPLMNEVGL